MTEILCLLLYPALLCVINPRKYFYLIPLTVVAWLLDVILCHTFWALAFGWPQGSEITISDTLERLCKTPITNKYWSLHCGIARAINEICPTHDHIKAVL